MLYVTFTYPVNGIAVEQDSESNWYIKKFDTTIIGSQLGLKTGDIIKRINNQDVDSFSSIVKWRTLDQSESILVNRNGKEFEVSTKDTPYAIQYDVFPILGEVISFLFAAILYMKIRVSRSAKFLTLVFITIGLIFMSLGGSIRGDALGKVLINTLLMLLPIIFLHFLKIFFNEKSNIKLPLRFLNLSYKIVASIFVIMLSFFITTPFSYSIHMIMTLITVLVFIIGLLLNFYFLTIIYWKYRKEKTYAATLIKTVWGSLFLSFFPIIAFSFVPLLIFGKVWLDSLNMGWFVLFFPITFAYLIVSKRLYDIDMILRRILYTTLISLVPSAILVAISGMITANDLTWSQIIIEYVIFVIVLTCILYSLEYFMTKLEPFMFPRKYQLQVVLKKLAKNLGSVSSYRELKEIFLIDIVNSLNVFGGAIVFKNLENIEIIREGQIDEEEIEELVITENWDHPYYSVFEINRHEEFTSYLIMTQKKTKTLLGLEEKQWLSLIITYLSVSLENVHLIRKLTVKLQQLAAQVPDEKVAGDFLWFRKLMLELQENERVRIATDLHDTTMQDLFFLKDRLHTMLEKYAFLPEDKEQMVSIIEYIDVINANLRQSCFELHPYLLKEIGLVQTIEKLVKFERAVSSFTIHFHATRTSIIEARDLESKRHIFRMVQELLNNAKKHSLASSINIRLTAVNESILFEYEDDGIGFEANVTLGVIEIGSSGIGMEQMKSRVLSLMGQFELETSKGKGLKFKAQIPLKEGKLG
ncbi:ATP-binding protein [Paenibacillus psychroresistens]|nr:ATP-binding protein [Paenibacillus psychroresistens]